MKKMNPIFKIEAYLHPLKKKNKTKHFYSDEQFEFKDWRSLYKEIGINFIY